MLILDRYIRECPRIGEAIQVVVLRVCDGKVRLGIRAPRHVPVYRENIYRRTEAERASLPAPLPYSANGNAKSLKCLRGNN
ncbi:carbon storage regulator [Paraburkholderia agricolaris]|uniref:carbon storage regulator n=1 Tax=Paraburkholderia agricolaris TaxID=2152888 RepID=UPI0038B7060D